MSETNDRAAAAPSTVPSLPQGAVAHCDLEYASADGYRLLLDLFLPNSQAPAPVVVWIHGGGWSAGDKNDSPAVYLVAEGFAVASIEYRLSGTKPFPAHIHDCKAAVRWLGANSGRYNLDGNRIGVWGASAGGHLVALLGTSGGVAELEGDVGGNLGHSSRVQAVCNVCGVSDVTALAQAWRDTKWMPYMDAFLGGPIEQFAHKAVAASPLAYSLKGAPPFFIVHGDQDDIVPVDQSIQLHAALQKAGVDSTLEIIQGAGHGGLGSPRMADRISDFFKRTLVGR